MEIHQEKLGEIIPPPDRVESAPVSEEQRLAGVPEVTQPEPVELSEEQVDAEPVQIIAEPSTPANLEAGTQVSEAQSDKKSLLNDMLSGDKQMDFADMMDEVNKKTG